MATGVDNEAKVFQSILVSMYTGSHCSIPISYSWAASSFKKDFLEALLTTSP